jgi:hypothetical protein
MTLTNQNDIHDEIKSRLNSGNACYHSVQNLLSSRLISKNLKIKIHKIYNKEISLLFDKLSDYQLFKNILHHGVSE